VAEPNENFHQVLLRIPIPLLELITQWHEEHGLTRTAAINYMLREFFVLTSAK